MLKSFLSYLINPIPTVLLLGAIGALFFWKNRPRTGKGFFMGALVYFLLISTPFLPNYLAHKLESQYAVLDPRTVTARDPHILVLGSGYNYHEALPPTAWMEDPSLARLVEGVRVYKALPGARLVLSAGSLSQPVTQAEAAARAALELGIAVSDTLMLTTPMTTYEEAEAFNQRFGNRQSLILVTSASHMPRAMKLFRSFGLEPIPAPADFMIKKDYGQSFTSYLPGAANIRKMERVIHEHVGMVWAAMAQS